MLITAPPTLALFMVLTTLAREAIKHRGSGKIIPNLLYPSSLYVGCRSNFWAYKRILISRTA